MCACIGAYQFDLNFCAQITQFRDFVCAFFFSIVCRFMFLYQMISFLNFKKNKNLITVLVKCHQIMHVIGIFDRIFFFKKTVARLMWMESKYNVFKIHTLFIRWRVVYTMFNFSLTEKISKLSSHSRVQSLYK